MLPEGVNVGQGDQAARVDGPGVPVGSKEWGGRRRGGAGIRRVGTCRHARQHATGHTVRAGGCSAFLAWPSRWPGQSSGVRGPLPCGHVTPPFASPPREDALHGGLADLGPVLRVLRARARGQLAGPLRHTSQTDWISWPCVQQGSVVHLGTALEKVGHELCIFSAVVGVDVESCAGRGVRGKTTVRLASTSPPHCACCSRFPAGNTSPRPPQVPATTAAQVCKRETASGIQHRRCSCVQPFRLRDAAAHPTSCA